MSHENYSSVIQTLNDCITACNHCYDACLKEEHVNMMVECIRLIGNVRIFALFSTGDRERNPVYFRVG